MMTEDAAYETDPEADSADPDSSSIQGRKLITQPYDLAIEAIVNQIKSDILFLRPLSDRPKFQRKYVWSDKLASKLVESVLLGVPIPPCYFSENEDCELDVIDGQQRIYSLYRFLENQFKLTGLEALTELSGSFFFELPSRDQRRFRTHTLRCVVITSESHPEIKFDVFERLNTNTIPLNAQELRNCIYRGPLNDLLAELADEKRWLSIRGRKSPDKRLADEELILRFFAYQMLGIKSYRTPLKTWLNEAALTGRKMNERQTNKLRTAWNDSLDFVLEVYEPREAFRRPNSTAINRALFDLLMHTASRRTAEDAKKHKKKLSAMVATLSKAAEFDDLISRAVDHKKRTLRRFAIWNAAIDKVFS